MRSLTIGSVWAERGFGLVEVLVAAAVLGVLAVIMVPVVQQRQQAAAESSAYGRLAGEQVTVHRYSLVGGIYRLELSVTGASGRGGWRYTITPSTITAQR